MKKFISVFTAITTILWLTGIVMVLPVNAAFADGDLAREADEFDVYIIKLVGTEKFKRLILNPDVFNMYGHLKWENVQVVANGTLDAYTTSTLVRADGDEKVYNLYPDGDTGTKKWVETLDCFTSSGFNWNSVYTINSFDRDSYTTASTNYCGVVVEEPEVTGELTLSLSPDTPAATTIPYDANNVYVMKVKVEGTGTISQMTLKREGAGLTADIGNAYLYEAGIRLTSGRTVSSATSKVTFINLSVDAPTTIDVVIDFAGSAGGNQHYFTLASAADVTSDATVGGSFPISGKPMSFAGTNVGTITVVDSGSTAYNVTIGDKEVEISQFKVSVSNEAAYLKRIRLYNGGTINSAYLTNLKLKYSGETKATADAFGSDGYTTFIFDEDYYIKKGGSAIFRVFADISGGKPAETIELYIELPTDIYAIGGTYGVGMNPSSTTTGIIGFDSTTAGEAVDVTLVGGDLTFVKIGPNAGNLGLDTDDTLFLEYSMTAIADITISRTRLFWCVKNTGSSTYSALETDFDDVTDIKITNKDTGVVWAGPNDGSTFTTTGTDYCPDSADGVYKVYTDTYDLTAAEAYTMDITGDVKAADYDAAGTNSDLDAGDIAKIGIYSFVTAAYCGNANFMKYTGTTNSVACTGIVPSGDIVGEEFTFRSPSLAVALAGSPSGTDASGLIGTARTFVKGKAGIEIVGFVFTAGVASDATVTDFTLTGYIDIDGSENASGDGVYTLGLEDTSGYVKNLVSSVEIWDTTTGLKIPGSTAKGFSGTSYSTVAYSGLNWVIPAGESRTLLVKGNLSSTGPTNSAGFNLISFDINAAATDITSHDEDGNDIAETGNDPNASVDPTVAIAIYNYGTIAVDDATDTPLQSIILMGSNNNEVSKFKITGTREGWYIDKFSIGIEESTASKSNFTGMSLKYQTKAQEGTSDWTISSDRVFAADATASFDFSGDARPYVPKDDYTYITVLVDVDGYDAGTGARTGEYTNFWALTAEDDEFKAYGVESGKLIEGGSTSIIADNVTGGDEVKTPMKNHYIFRSRPVFAKKAWSGDINELARFTITAQGYDVTFDGTSSDGFYMAHGEEATPDFDNVVSAALEFDIIASGTDNTEQILYLYDWNNEIISSVNDYSLAYADSETESVTSTSCDIDTSSTYDVCLTTVSFQFEEASTAVVIAKDVTREFYVMIDNTLDFNNQDEYIQLKMKQDEGTITTWPAEDGSDFWSDSNCSIVWYDGTNDESAMRQWDNALCMPSNMKGIGDFPFSFRLLQGTQQ